MASDVDRIHKEFTDLIDFLASNGEISLRSRGRRYLSGESSNDQRS